MKLCVFHKVTLQTLKILFVCDIINTKDGDEMYKDKGIYVFPEGDTMKVFAFDGKKAIEYPSITYAEQLVNFLEIEMSVFRKAINNLKSYDDATVDEETLTRIFYSIYHLADIFYVDCPVYSFLMTNELRLLDEEYASFEAAESAVLRKNKGLQVLDVMTDLQAYLFYLCNIYCMTEGTHEAKVREVITNREYIFNIRFEKIVSTSPPDVEMFQGETFCFPFTKGYRFSTLKDYLWFVFINFLQYDYNFSECQHCGHFFIPKTKRKTLYCDRVRTEDGRTCKSIGPSAVSRRNAEFSVVLSEYDKAVNRNFKRVERFESRGAYDKKGKDLDYNDYSEWLERLHKVREEWKNGKVDDSEILNVIHELD